MARRKLSLEAQLKGVKAALRSPRTPEQLKPALRRREKALEKEVEAKGSGGNQRGSKKQSPRKKLLFDFESF